MNLVELVASIRLPGWRFWVDENYVHVQRDPSPSDRDDPSELMAFGDYFLAVGDEEAVVVRLFCTLQFLQDHELREQFTVNGVRVFEAHDPPVTGPQKEWFVEHASALRGY